MQTTNKKCAIYEWLYILLAVTLGEVSVVFILWNATGDSSGTFIQSGDQMSRSLGLLVISASTDLLDYSKPGSKLNLV